MQYTVCYCVLKSQAVVTLSSTNSTIMQTLKNFLTLGLLLVTAVAYAQVPNGDFENWTNKGNYEVPDGWATGDSLINSVGATTFTVTKSTDARTGTYAMKVSSVSITVGSNNLDFAGLAEIGNGGFPDSYGVPYITIPDSFKFSYKFVPNVADTVMIVAQLKAWDANQNRSVAVAYAGIVTGTPAATWQDISEPFQLDPTNGSLTPDTITFFVWLINDGVNPNPGSYVVIDAMSFVGGGGTGPTAPAAPTNLTVNPLKATANGGMALAWDDNSNNELGFIIQRSEDNVTFADVDTTAADATSFTDQGLSDGTQYYYRVVAYNATGNSAPSNTVNATALVGVEEARLNETLKLYPNPSSGILTVQLPAEGQVSLQVYDLAGKQLLTHHLQANGMVKESVDISKLSNGTYWVRITTPNAETTRTISVLK